MIRKLKTKFLIVLLGVYLAGALSIFPVTSDLTQNNSLNFPVKQASAQSITCPNLIDYSSVNLTTKIAPAFIKITKDGKTLDGQQVRINATVTLNSHDKIGFDTGFRTSATDLLSVWLGDPYCIDSVGFNDWIEELRLVGVNEKNKETACRFSSFYQCSEQYESPPNFFEERYLNRSEPTPPFSLALTAENLANMNILSSPQGTVNRIIIIPRFYTANNFNRIVPDADFPDAGAILTLQVFDTEDQLRASGSTVPPGVETETEATGGNSGSNKLKTCFTKAPDAVFCVLNLFLGAIGSLLEQLIKVIWANIIAEGLRITLAIRTYSDDFANVIYPAWIILRNLTNIAFILAIIAMGIATVFRISGWMVRDLMIKLIIGAFLVNFSLVIPQAILGIAETVQNQFLSADSGAINAISNQLLSFHLFDNSTKNFGSFSETIRIFMNLWVVLFAFIAFCGILFIVVVRMIVIWILLMVSPLIYAAYIFPATKSFFNKWWSTFMKWAFISAAIGFMLNLTAIVTFQSRDLLVGLSGVNPATIGGERPLLFEFMTQLIPIIFLYATVKVATSMGSGINSFVDKTLAKGTSFATGLGAGSAIGYSLKGVGMVGKGIHKVAIEPATDKLRTKYNEKLATYTAPDDSDSGFTKMKKKAIFFAGAPKKFLADIKETRKGNLESAKARVADVSQDYRNRASGKPLYAADKAHNKRVEEAAEKLINETDTHNNQVVKDYLRDISLGKKLSDYEQADLQARINKSVENKQFKDVLDDPLIGKDITKFYDLMSKAGSNEMQSKNRASSLAAKLNSGFISSGSMHNVVNADNPTLLNDTMVGGQVVKGARSKRAVILQNKSDLEKVSAKSFIQGTDIATATSLEPAAAESLASFILSTKDPRTLSEKLSEMTPDNRADYKTLLNNGILRAQLHGIMDTQNGGPDVARFDSEGNPLAPETIAQVIDRFKSKL